MTNNWRLLSKLIKKGKRTELLRLLDKLCDIDILKDESGCQLTHASALSRQPLILFELLRRGFDLESKCNDGNTIIHYACASGSLCCVSLLMQLGANLKEPNNVGDCPCDVISVKNDEFRKIVCETEKESERQKEKMEVLKTLLLNMKNKFDENETWPISIVEDEIVLDEIMAKGPHITFIKSSFCSTDVLIKKISSQNEFETQYELLLVKEALMTRNLRHSNILLFMGVCLQYATCSLIFEHPSNGFLHRKLFNSEDILTSKDILNIAKGLANAISYLHDADLIHCAVATFSVTLFPNMHPKLCNFEYMITKSETKSISHIPSLYPYMAIEQLQGCPADQSNDVFGLGVIIFECMTRKKVSHIDSQQKRIDNKNFALHRLRYIPKDFEQSLKVLVGECFKSKDKRPNAFQINGWLSSILSGELTSQKPSQYSEVKNDDSYQFSQDSALSKTT